MDEAIAWMTVIDHIPSSLWIAETEQYLYFHYAKQPQTCHNCGDSTNAARQCEVYLHTHAKDRPNAANIDLEDEDAIIDEEVPENMTETPEDNTETPEENTETPDDNVENPGENEVIPEANVSLTHASEETDSSDTDASRSRISTESDSDIEENVMETTSGFTCTQCESICDTVHELDEHMRVHADSYANRAKSPPRVGVSASQPTVSSHVQSTNDTANRKKECFSQPEFWEYPYEEDTMDKNQ